MRAGSTPRSASLFINFLSAALNPQNARRAFGLSRLNFDTASIPSPAPPGRTMMPSRGTCGSGRTNGNRCSRGTASARPIGVNAPMTSPQAAPAASQAAPCELPNTAHRAALALIKTNAPALAVLNGLQRIGPYVVPGVDPEQPRHDLKRPWDAVTKRAGVTGVRLHDLRHTYASFGAGGGLGLPIIGRLLGHS